MANIKIAVWNRSTVLCDAVVGAVVPTLQAQVHRDFAPIWGIDADLTFVSKAHRPAAGSWWLVVADNSDVAGTLGYHDLTPEGLPLGFVFAATDQQLGLQWTVTASHELIEMLGDPDVNLYGFVQTGGNTGTFYAYELCDPVNSMNRDIKSMVSESRISCTRSGSRVSVPQEARGLIMATILIGLFSSFRVVTALCLRCRLAWGGIRSVSLLRKDRGAVRNNRH